jgi:protein-S-isoprenylcysteine O-methyltransferase Ste14
MPLPAADRPNTFPWPPIVLASSIVLAVVLDEAIVRLSVPFAETAFMHFAGIALLYVGLALIVWAALQFRSHGTSIRPDRGSSALIADGPFALTRNPFYLGEAVALAGAGFAANRLGPILVAPLFALAVDRLAIRREEAYLERRFGDHYLAYKDRVRRWL